MEIRRCRHIGIIIILVGLCVLVTGQRQNINRRRIQLQQQPLRQNNLLRSRQNGGGQRLRGTTNFNGRNNNVRIQQRNRLQPSMNQNQRSINRLQQPRNIVRTRLQNNQRQNMRQLQRPVLQNSNRIQNSNSFTTLQPVRSTLRNMQQRTSGQNSFQVTTLQPVFSTQPNVQNYTTISDSNTIKVSEGDVAVKGGKQHGLKLHGIQQQQLLQSQEQYPQQQDHSQLGGMQHPPQHLNGHHMSGIQQQLQPQEYYLLESNQQQLLLPREHYQESQHLQVLLPQEYSSQESRHQHHMQPQDNRLRGHRQLQLVQQTERHLQLQPQDHYSLGDQHQQELQAQLQPHHQRKMEYSSLSQQRQLNQQQQQDQGNWGLRHGHTHQQKLPEQQHQQLQEQQHRLFQEQRQGHGQGRGQKQQQNGNIQQHQSQEPKQEPQQRSLLHQRQSQTQQVDQSIQRPQNLQEKRQEQKQSRQQFSDLKPNPPKQQEGRSTRNDQVLDNGSNTLSRSPVKSTHSSFGHTDNTNQAIHGNEPLHGLSNSVPQGLLPEYLDRPGNMGASHRYRAVLESNEGLPMRNGVRADSNLSPIVMPRESGIDSGHRSPLILHPSSKQMLNIPNPDIGIQSQSSHRSNNLQRQERVDNAGEYPIRPTGNAAGGSVDSQMPSRSGSFSDIDQRRHEIQPQGSVVDRKGNFNTKYQNINAGGQVLQVKESKYPSPYKDNQKSGNKIYTNTQFYPDQTNNHGRLQHAQAAIGRSHSSRSQKAHRGNIIPDPLPVNPIYVHDNDVLPGRKELTPGRQERNTSLNRTPTTTTRRVLDLKTDMNSGNRDAGIYNHHDSTHPIMEHNIDSTSIYRKKTQNSGKPITANDNRRITIAQSGTNVYATNKAGAPSLSEASTTNTGAYEGSNHNAPSLAYRHFDHVQERHSQQHQRQLHHRQQPEQHHQHSHQVQGQQDQQQSLRQQIKEQQPNQLKHHERTRAQTDISLNNDAILRSGVQMLSLENQNNFHSSTSNNANKAISGSEPFTTNSNRTAQGRRLEHLDRQSSMGASYTHHNMLETNQGLAIQSQSLTSNVMGHAQHANDPNYASNPGSYTDNRTPENTQYTLHRPGQQGTRAFYPRENEPSQISQSQTSLNSTATTSNKYDTQANDRTQFVDRNGASQLGSPIGYQTGSDLIVDTVRQEPVGQWQDSTGLSQSKDFGQPLHEPYSQHQSSSLNQHLNFDQPHQGKHYPDTTSIDSHGSLQGTHQNEYYPGNQFPTPIEYPPPNQYLDAHQYLQSPESALPSHRHLSSSNEYPLPSNQHSQSSNHYQIASDQYPLVSDQYPLVSDQYSPLSNQYAPQSHQHAPPPNQYVPSSNQHLSPSDQYPPLPDQHSPLSDQYAPPPNQHVPDSNQYPSSSNQHLPPSNQYDPPLDQPNQYAPPSNQNAAQSNQYPPPSNQDLPPSNQYVSPLDQLNQYAPLSNQNAAQSNQYQPPSNHHLPPSNQYAPPYDQYPPASNQHLPLPDQYPPPPNQYPAPPIQ
ncbi:hypothetical protein SNE40_004227 [Patella caerulea]|uniref:Uncharacterized protein n=1 Tax=Patella caerulea TaxID=87958 RepID=A0AAN8KK02_PATCE